MSLNISSDPADFTGQTNTIVTFAPDETVQIVNVSVVNDNTLESTEMFTAMLTAAPGSMVMIGAATATATITDDDSKPCFIELCANQCTTVCSIGMISCHPSLVTVQCCKVYTINCTYVSGMVCSSLHSGAGYVRSH